MDNKYALRSREIIAVVRRKARKCCKTGFVEFIRPTFARVLQDGHFPEITPLRDCSRGGSRVPVNVIKGCQESLKIKNYC